MRTAMIVAGIGLMLVLGSAQAGLAEGVAAIGKGDFKLAQLELQLLAEEGRQVQPVPVGRLVMEEPPGTLNVTLGVWPAGKSLGPPLLPTVSM